MVVSRAGGEEEAGGEEAGVVAAIRGGEGEAGTLEVAVAVDTAVDTDLRGGFDVEFR